MGAVGLQQHLVIASALDSDVDHAKGWSCGWPLESMIVEAVDYTGEEASSNGEANWVKQGRRAQWSIRMGTAGGNERDCHLLYALQENARHGSARSSERLVCQTECLRAWRTLRSVCYDGVADLDRRKKEC